MDTPSPADIRRIPLERLHYAETPAQISRRAHYDPTALNELAETFKSEGQLQPIVVRPIVWNNATKFEIVAGERRARAMKIAGNDDILATVRELDDHQAAKIRLIENLQREEEHPLAEAEGYEELVKVHGYTVDQIAAETGKSKAYVYARLKLLALSADGRKTFYDGKVSASIALLAARIPVAELQRQYLQKVLKGAYGDGEPLSYRDAQQLAQTEFMLRLDQAPFRTSDPMLVPEAGACGTCPKNTSCQPELFADISTKTLCTDPVCFAQKKAAAIAQKIEAARATGQAVITGKEAKKIAPNGMYDLRGGYAKLEESCADDPKYRPWKQLLGKKAKPILLETPDGKLIEVIEKTAALKQLHDDGVLRAPKTSFNPTRTKTAQASSKTARAKAKAAHEIDEEFEKRLFLAIHAKAPKQLPRATLELLIDTMLDVHGIDNDTMLKAWGWSDVPIIKDLKKLTEPQLHQLLFELTFLSEHCGLEPTAKLLKIDVKKIRAEVAIALKPPAPAKAAKKKAARK